MGAKYWLSCIKDTEILKLENRTLKSVKYYQILQGITFKLRRLRHGARGM